MDGSIRGDLRKQALDHFNAEGSEVKLSYYSVISQFWLLVKMSNNNNDDDNNNNNNNNDDDDDDDDDDNNNNNTYLQRIWYWGEEMMVWA